ncbi:MAG: class I SAM-dependent methyltransferase [Gemmatimonadetes bacterium]|nr:class I SAM-dependent methyltransferase [Gemmatimonadota bacterium]
MNLLGRLHRRFVFERRIRVLSALLADLLPRDATVLDVGCGDGSLDRKLLAHRPDLKLSGIDVQVRADAMITVGHFDGSRIPFEDRSIDAVMFVDVLHHTEDPEQLLREGLRVAREVVVLKDHTCDGAFARPTLRLMDWVGNAPHAVVLPYNYWREVEWRQAFERLGGPASVWITHLRLYPAPASWLFDRSLHFVARLAVHSMEGP